MRDDCSKGREKHYSPLPQRGFPFIPSHLRLITCSIICCPNFCGSSFLGASMTNRSGLVSSSSEGSASFPTATGTTLIPLLCKGSEAASMSVGFNPDLLSVITTNTCEQSCFKCSDDIREDQSRSFICDYNQYLQTKLF